MRSSTGLSQVDEMKYRKAIYSKIKTDNRWLEKSIYVLWKRQADIEKETNKALYINDAGFGKTDVRFLSSLGYDIDCFVRGGGAIGFLLSEKQRAIAKRLLEKYTGQLLKIIIANNNLHMLHI